VIIGVGTDTVIIDRVRKIFARWGDRFAQRVLGPGEYREFLRRKGKTAVGLDRAVRYLAKRFAAKEAIGKALGVGLHYPMSLHAVEILNDAKGAPRAVPHKALASYIEARNYEIHVSISDEIENAQALAIVEGGRDRAV
jgi:holo-[acyl-carrier protein] synthase